MTPKLPGYQIGEKIYEGTRTLVYRGIRRSDSLKVAIKFLRNSYPSFSELIQFRNQYTIAKNLNPTGILQPLSLERYGNGYALVMEDLGAVSLEKALGEDRSLDLGSCLDIAIQLADILQELYRHWVIHKDIKPANILIQPETKEVKLIDFSIASLLPREAQEIKKFNVLEGTLAYISPEQTGRMNRGIDYRSDFYSLGATLYQLLTGVLPFSSSDPIELVHCHISQQPLPPEARNPVSQRNRVSEIPPVVSQIVMKLLAKNAEDRYQSALGLKFDLETCLNQWQETGKIKAFELATRDIAGRFLIPEKLYGREVEVETLLAAFERVANPPQPPRTSGGAEGGGIEMMLVAGFSGIGKTAVVNEVHKPIVRQRGYFIKGKFDQFQRNIPFSAFAIAFRDLIEQLLVESDAKLAEWQEKIFAALGENGQVIIDVIPELELLIGKQPPVPELSGSAAQNRFNLLFQKLIKVFATPEHPLVIFVDDLQWADSASLKLMQLLASESDTGDLLLLGAYRDNEVFPAHPLILVLDEIVKSGASINTITLAPLSETNINCLVADTLSCTQELAWPLTELIYQKTKGNPFFATQFLKGLYEDGFIAFNRELGYWLCDMTGVRQLALTSDVVEFMASRLHKLPQATQEILKLAACIGNQFDLETLAIISEREQMEVATSLWKALQEGLVLPVSETYKFFQGNNQEEKVRAEEISVGYKFLHDRVQQAAYSLISDDTKKASHLKIGRLLLKKSYDKEREDKIFDIVNNINQGIELIAHLHQRQELAQLNLQAGRKAKNSIAYSEATSYLKTGIALLVGSGWETDYRTNLELYSELADSQYLSGQLEAIDATANVVLERARSLLDTIPIYITQISSYQAQGKILEGLDLGLQIINKIGVCIPKKITTEEIEKKIGETLIKFKSKSIEELILIPRSSDPHLTKIQEILTLMIGCAYKVNPQLFPFIVCEQVALTIERGNLPISASIYAAYGILLCGYQDFESGYRTGKVALGLMKRFPEKQFEAKVLNLVFTYINPWKSLFKNSLPYLKQGFTVALEVGDLEYAAYSINHYCQLLYYSGMALEVVDKEMDIYCQTLQTLKQDSILYLLQILHQTVVNLREKNKEGWRLEGDAMKASKMLPYFQSGNFRFGIAYIYVNQLVLSYLFGETSRAIELASLASDDADSLLGDLCISQLYFYRALSHLAILEGESIQVAEDLEKVKKLAHYAPMNFRHQVNLIEAEQFRVAGKKLEAMELYDLAIAGAKENEYIQEEGLANELAAKFYLEWGKEKIAATYMQDAYYCYARWGAKAKVDDLQKRYPQLLSSILQGQKLSLKPSAALATMTKDTLSKTTTGVGEFLDLATLMKASRTLSEDISLEGAIANLMQVVKENAGAETVALMLLKEHVLMLTAKIKGEEVSKLDTIPVENSNAVPLTIVNKVKYGQQPLLLENASQDAAFCGDAYIQNHQPQSILCLPLVDRGQLRGILYLENNQVAGAFTGDRLDVLNLLCSQAAISLENAQLYQRSQQALKDLQQAQLQLVQSEKMATLGNLVAGVGHEINNPLGFICGNINVAQKNLQDLLNALDLYQQKYPSPDAELTEELEALDLDFIVEDFPKLIASMQSGVERIRQISISLRTFSRKDTETQTAYNLHEGLDSTLLILKYRLKANEHRPAIEIIKDYGELPEIQCYPGQINQVFMNLFANAIDALEESRAGFSLQEIVDNSQQICIKTKAKVKEVIVRISDNGKGMSPEVLARLFEQGFTTKGVGKGTGLGMAIAKEIVEEKHGGAIACVSELGSGTEFIISLPFCQSQIQNREITDTA